MGTIKTKPFDLEAIKNGAKWGVFGMGYNPTLYFGQDRFLMRIFKSIDSKDLCISIDGSIQRIIGDNLVVYSQNKYQILLIEESKIASDLSDLKVGDNVWEFKYGWGIVDTIQSNTTYPIFVKFPNLTIDEIGFTKDGRGNVKFSNQTLFLTEIKFEIPEV